MKIVIAPDSFKGTLRAAEVCSLAAKAARRVFPQSEIVEVPMADGGEGTVDALLARGGERRKSRVSGPFFEEVEAEWGVLPDGTAVIETASCAGLPLAGERKNPEETTTFGVGELIRSALSEGAERILLGLGGSATNDGGLGMLSALGGRFFDADGAAFVPTGRTLARVTRADLSALRVPSALTVITDVENPLCGPLGAAAIYGPQKGADPDMVGRLDRGLFHIAELFGKEEALRPGSGAAGGMGFAAARFLGGRLVRGVDAVAEAVGLAALLEGASLLVTGEGRVDRQSLMGKTVGGLAALARRSEVPLLVLCGMSNQVEIEALGGALLPISRIPLSEEELGRDPAGRFAQTALEAFRLIELGIKLARKG